VSFDPNAKPSKYQGGGARASRRPLTQSKLHSVIELGPKILIQISDSEKASADAELLGVLDVGGAHTRKVAHEAERQYSGARV
jgi:hypothetical protein